MELQRLREIQKMDDSQKMNIIDNYGEYNLDRHDIRKIAGTIKNKDFMEKLIHNYQDYTLNNDDVVDLLLGSHDDDLRKEVLNDYQKYDIDDIDALDIARGIGDNEFKKELFYDISNDKNRYGIDNDPSNLALLALSVDDNEFRQEVVDNAEKYNFGETDVFRLNFEIRNSKDKQQSNSELNKMLDNSEERNVNDGKSRTI